MSAFADFDSAELLGVEDRSTRLQEAMAQDELDEQDAAVREAGGLVKALHHASQEVRAKARAVLERSYTYNDTYRCRLPEEGDRSLRARVILRQWRIKFLFILDGETDIGDLWILTADLPRFQEHRQITPWPKTSSGTVARQ